jgi:hypothetical protein
MSVDLRSTLFDVPQSVQLKLVNLFVLMRLRSRFGAISEALRENEEQRVLHRHPHRAVAGDRLGATGLLVGVVAPAFIKQAEEFGLIPTTKIIDHALVRNFISTRRARRSTAPRATPRTRRTDRAGIPRFADAAAIAFVQDVR